MLGHLKRIFESRDPSLCEDFYVLLVKPHLEYAIQTLNSHLVSDTEKLELLQRRTLTLPKGFENVSCCEIQHRLRCFKYIKVQKKTPFLIKIKDFTDPTSFVSGNTLKLCRELLKSRLRNYFSQSFTVRHNFISNRVVPMKKSLPVDVVTFSTFNTLKSNLHMCYKVLSICAINVLS